MILCMAYLGGSYADAQIGCCDESAAGVDLVHLHETVGEAANHIRGVVQVACLFLVQLGQGGKCVWARRVLDDCSEGL